MNKRKLNHLQALEKLGFKASQFNRLRFLENRAHYWAEKYCNGDLDGNDWDAVIFDFEQAIKKLHGGTLPNGFFVNGDPRGYALKISAGESYEAEYHPEYIPEGLYKDWGGFGVLAPEF